MKFKKSVKNTWKTLTSPKAKKTYASAGRTFSKVGAGAAKYFQGANRGLDNVLGTYDPNKGQLAGVKLKKRRRTKKRSRK